MSTIETLTAQVNEHAGQARFVRYHLTKLDGTPLTGVQIVNTKFGLKYRVDESNEWIKYPAGSKTLQAKGYGQTSEYEVGPAKVIQWTEPGADSLSPKIIRDGAKVADGWVFVDFEWPTPTVPVESEAKIEILDTPSGNLLKRAMEISDERNVNMGEAMEIAKAEAPAPAKPITPAEASPLIAAQHANEQEIMAAGFEPAFDGPSGVPLHWRRGQTVCTMTEAVFIVRGEKLIAAVTEGSH